MIISGWDEYLNTDVKTNYTTLVITGNLALNSPATPYTDDCTVLLSGIAPPEVTSGIYIYQTGVCGASTGVTNKVTKIAYGSGLSVDFLNNNATGIVKLDFKIGGDESGCFAQVKNTYNATGITFGSGLKVGYTECGNVHVNSQFGAAGSSSECFTSLTNYRNITGITFGTGLSVTNTDCGLHVNSRFYISGDPDGCRGEYYSKSNLTGLLIGRGLRAVDDSAACATKLTTNIYASGSSDDTAINVKTRDWDAIQFTGNLRLIDSGCKVLVSGYGESTPLSVTGLGSCNGSDYFRDTTVSQLGFRKGLFVQDDGVGNPIVDSIFYVEGTTDTVGCGKLFSPQNVTGIKFGNGLELANGDTNECNLVVRSKFGVVGDELTDCGDVTASVAEPYITGLDFRNGLSLTTDGCNAIISGTPTFRVGGIAGTCGGTDVDHRIVSGIQFGTGLLLSDPNSCDATVNLNFKAGGDTSECFSSVSVTENITGITFGTGLRVGADGCNLHVNSRFFISGSDAACRGTKTTGHHITGLLVGVGLSETDNGNCQSVIDLNLSASGSSTLGGSVSKIVGWDAIQFTGNLTVESVDPCTIMVSGVDSRIPVTGSTNPCNPANDTVEDPVAGIVFGTGLKTTSLSDGSVHVNSRFYVSGDGSVCGGTWASGEIVSGIKVGAGLKATNASCVSDIELNFNARQAAKCGSAAGASSQISALTFGTGLNFTTNGCTGVIISDITVDGSTFSDPCDVGSRSNAFANKRFENIDFAGYLSSAIDGCNVIVSGRKSPINAGNTAASLFEAINLIGGTGVTITSSGTCNAVINSTAGTISVTGSSDSCTDARDVTVGGVETFIFGTGLRTTALGDAVLIDSPLTVAGRPITDSCTSPPTEGASFDGQLNNITFTGYLSATQTDCSVVVEGTRSPITIAKSGTFCGTESSESGEVQTLNLGSGLQVDINGCSATLRTDLKVGAAASCGGGAVTPGIFQTLEFGTGFVVNEKAGEECTWQINSDFSVSGKTSCSGDTYVSVPNVSNLVFGNGMTVSDDGSCQVTVSSEKKIGGGGNNGCLGSPEGTTVDYDTLLVSGLGLSVEDCTATISGPRMLIEQEAVCNRSAVDPFPYQSITVSTGLYLTESSCGATLTAGVKVNHYEPDCNGNSQTANYFTGIVAGRGLNVGGGGNSCSVSIDAGLSGVRSGSNIRGQFTNCGSPSNATLTSNSCITDGDNAQANRGIPEQIRGIWTGPGIGASIGNSSFGGSTCEEDTLLLFANNAVSGLGGTCGEVELGLQVYTTKYSNVFSIGGTNGLDLLTNSPVDGSTLSHGYNIRLNEGGGNWSCTVVTGIEVTKNGSYVTDVQPLNGTFGGSVSCEEADATSVGLPGEEKKFWLKAVPCVT